MSMQSTTQSNLQAIVQLPRRCKAAASLFWDARSGQERQLLVWAGAIVLLALLYLVLIAPALDGRARLRQELPQLRLQAAEMQALSAQAATLAGQAPTQVASMSSDSLNSSLAARGLTPQSLAVTGEYAKLRLSGVPFSSLIDWLAAQRRESRIAVQEANIVAQPAAGLVDATLTLHQGAGAVQ